MATTTPIRTVVVVLQENHTFDNYFGTYPGAEGTLGKQICLLDSPGSSNCVSPFRNSSLTPAEMTHSWGAAHADYDGGKMDGFLYSEKNAQTMGYYERADLPHYWAAADNYVLCDRYFTSVMSQSAPNHLFLVAGTSGGVIDNNVPATLNFPPIFEQLDASGISWKVYSKTASWYRNFSYVQGKANVTSNFGTAADFAKDLTLGHLAQVSWIIGAPGGDEHPPANVQLGSNSVASDVVNPFGQSKYWESGVVFVTWDDYGGFYDHVVPPQVDQFGYGFRVPCLVISAFSKVGFIDHTANDHTSILRFIENNFALKPLAARDAAAHGLGEAFDFDKPARVFTPI